MSTWQDEGVEILRILINDFSNSPTYSDEDLEQLLLVSARYVIQEINFSTTYTIDHLAGTITPTPEDTLVSFMVLKAACLTNVWTFNSKALMDGIASRCGPAQISVKSDAKLILGLLQEGPCKTYADLATQFNFGNPDIVKGILSPFVSNTFLPTDNNNYRN